jgi:predicted ArsR family transcriptional regulator
MLEILRFFLLSTDPAFIVPEVSDEFDVTDATARTRMDKMVEEGYLKKKKTGRRSVLYWPTDEGLRYYVSEASIE